MLRAHTPGQLGLADKLGAVRKARTVETARAGNAGAHNAQVEVAGKLLGADLDAHAHLLELVRLDLLGLVQRGHYERDRVNVARLVCGEIARSGLGGSAEAE